MAGLIDIAHETGVKVHELQGVFEAILGRVASGESVRIKGFGTFKRRKFAGRTLVTPIVPDGQVTFQDSFALRFHQSQLVKVRLNTKPKSKEKGEKAAKGDKKAKKAKPEAPAPAPSAPPEGKPRKPKKSKSKE